MMSMMMAMTSLALDHHGYGLTLISVSVSLHVVGMFGFSIPFGRLERPVRAAQRDADRQRR